MLSNACTTTYKKSEDFSVFKDKTEALNLMKEYTDDWLRICASENSLNASLNEIKSIIQTKRNNSTLSKNDIVFCMTMIKKSLGCGYQKQQAEQAINFLKCCVFIARHEDGFLHKINTKLNRNTDSINKSISNDSYYRISYDKREKIDKNTYVKFYKDRDIISKIDGRLSGYADLMRDFDGELLIEPSKINNDSAISEPIKARIMQHMDKINEIVEYSPTANYAIMARKDPQGVENYRALARKETEDIRDPKNTNRSLRPFQKGNCGEINELLYHLIQNDPEIPSNFKSAVRIGRLDRPDDHVMICVRHEDDNGNVDYDILDHWSRYAEINDARNMCNGVMPKYGFIGAFEDYLRLINSFEDNLYLKKNNFHRLVEFRVNSLVQEDFERLMSEKGGDFFYKKL
ncbi:hypothetical protein [Pandoraea oxalativorans]|nr:hypothetical protein [Pandoraea oxalativorans]